MTYVLVFFSTLVADVVWAKYITATADKRRLCASIWSAAIIALGGFNVTQYALNWKTIFPAIAGAFLGTWLAVKK